MAGMPLATLAEFLVEVGATTAGGAIIVSTVVGLVGLVVQGLVVDQTVPIRNWMWWGGLIGAFGGLVDGLYEYA
jgi:hypothetical protein